MAKLRADVDAGRPWAEARLCAALASRGDEDAIAEMQARADAGDPHAAFFVAKAPARKGGKDALAQLRSEMNAGNSEDAADALFDLYAAGDPEHRKELRRYGLDPDGFPAA